MGRTPLDLAKRKGHSGIVSLLEKGAHSGELMMFKDSVQDSDACLNL